MLISVSTFSQSISKELTSKPKVIVDSTGITFLAFNEEQINTIIKELKKSDINKKIIIELEKKIDLMKKRDELQTKLNDSLNAQLKTFMKININLNGEISIQEKKIAELNKNIEDYKTIENNLKEEIEIYKGKIKRKNGMITKLIITNVITGVILILIII